MHPATMQHQNGAMIENVQHVATISNRIGHVGEWKECKAEQQQTLPASQG
jgi:hypothetical protein